jgi:hypothetical protein
VGTLNSWLISQLEFKCKSMCIEIFSLSGYLKESFISRRIAIVELKMHGKMVIIEYLVERT